MNSFKDVIGHDDILNYIRIASKSQTVSHAYIMYGEKGSGKKMLANLFANTLLCEKGLEDPCNDCGACKQIEAGTHPDLIYVTHEKEASIGVEDIRRQIGDTVDIRPYQGKYKIYIMDNAQIMTTEAQNALLKILEEPPSYVVIMLLTDNVDALLSTITSRCVMLRIHQIREELIASYLVANEGIDEEYAKALAAFSRGNIGRAKDYLHNEDYKAVVTSALSFLTNIGEMSTSDLINRVKEALKYKVTINEYLDIMLVWFRDILLYKATYDVRKVIFVDRLKTIKDLAMRCSYEDIQYIIDRIRESKKRISANVNFELTIELLFTVIKEICG
ncbi:MAG: DNA polymerase III subunit delta' [Lachnospiraceae bacterium]|jgi:DNA polymerase-3 subunit delta'|nr:DNA polymerase III subunit delta' [Lachnospiraceae bacterium]